MALTLSWNPGFFSNGYQRHQYQWNYTYGYNVPFMPPLNADPRTHHLWHQASQIFRHFDKDWNGRMSHHEFRKALNHTGYGVPEYEADRLFAMVDMDRSGKLNEMEFAEFWVFSHGGAPFQLAAAPGYGAPAAYGAPPPQAYGAPAAYGAPPQAYGAPGGAAVSFAWNPQYIQSYQRHPYQWGYTYGYNQPFMPPLNADPRTHHLWHQASQIFRHFDKDWNGRMSRHEFHKALNHTGYNLPDYETERMFYMVDTDRSGKLNEMEFAEFWVYAHGGSPFHLQGYQTTTTTTTTYQQQPAPMQQPYGAPQPQYGQPQYGGAPAPGYGGGAGVTVGVGAGGFGVQASFGATPY